MCPTAMENYQKDIYNTNFELPGVERVVQPAAPADEPVAA